MVRGEAYDFWGAQGLTRFVLRESGDEGQRLYDTNHKLTVIVTSKSARPLLYRITKLLSLTLMPSKGQDDTAMFLCLGEVPNDIRVSEKKLIHINEAMYTQTSASAQRALWKLLTDLWPRWSVG